ncbi:MAG: DNA alkylation repair protein [Bacteroidaceae bacterium]|nr:DNA alkylation repair protein [Bacteroidaceae bacterium]
MFDVQSSIKEIKAQLRSAMNGFASTSMREKGLSYKVNFGVELPRLKEIASQFEKNHDLAQALWKENIRECKILAGMLQPVETFYPEIMDIWIEAMPTVEIAEMTCMHLFQFLPYAPQKSLQLIASEGEYQQICGYLTIARLLGRKRDLEERVENELLDQAVAAFIAGPYAVRKAVQTALRKYLSGNEPHAFTLYRLVEPLKNSADEQARLLWQWVKQEVELNFS